MSSRRFQDLIAWQKARRLVQNVYVLSREWPADERLGLISQARRAAVSVMANIAEGAGRGIDADFHRFLRLAYGSLMEVESHIYAAIDLGFANEGESKATFEISAETGRVLNGLMAFIRPSNAKGS